MASVQQLIDQLNASSPDKQWKLFGGDTPQEDTAPVTIPASPDGLTPAQTVNRGTGLYYVVVQDANGTQRKLPLKVNDPALLKAGLELKQSGVNDTVPDTTPDAKGRIDPSKTKPNPNLYNADLRKVQWDSGGPLADVPAGPTTKQPSATSNLTALDSKGNVVPAGDPSAKQMRDDATGTTFNLVTDPAGTLHDVGQEVWLVKPDGTHTVVGSTPEKATTTNVPNLGLVEYDPSKPAGSRATVVMPVPTDPNNLGGIQVRNGVSYVPTKDADGTIRFVEASGLPADQTVDHYYDDPNSRYVQLLDKQGNVIKQVDKGPDWKPPVRVQPGTAPAPDAINPKIPTFNPTTGALEFVDNPNQVKASDATAEIAKQLGVKVAAGQMSEDAAQKLITSAINVQNSQSQKIQADAAAQQAKNAAQQNIATAAGDVLRTTQTGAQTGANLLQNRVTSATGALTSLVSSAASSKMTSIPGGVGQGLVSGLTDWVTGLGGGQDVYDTAARMVQAADPKISQDPTLANQAQQTLGNMLALYQKQNGDQPHPLVAATQAANASAQNGGATAPSTYNPNDPQWNQRTGTPGDIAGRVVGPGGVILGPNGQPAGAPPPRPAVPAQAPAFVAPISGVPGANYGAATAYTGGVAPWLAQPGPGFVAPMIPTP